jgi:hypothetical protein
MPTLGEKLQELKQIQLDLRTAIESKGIVVGDAPFEDYPGFITSISGGVFDTGGFWFGESVTWDGNPVTVGAE